MRPHERLDFGEARVITAFEVPGVVDQDHVCLQRVIEDCAKLGSDRSVFVPSRGDAAGEVAVEPEESGRTQFAQDFRQEAAAVTFENADVRLVRESVACPRR